jgi:hypothetical protein
MTGLDCVTKIEVRDIDAVGWADVSSTDYGIESWMAKNLFDG